MPTHVIKGHTINTTHVKPPIPTRAWDYSAVLDGYDAGDPMGWGETEQAAIDDLLQQLEERT